MGIKRNDLNIPRNEEYKIIILPSDILETVKAKLGDEFIWDYDSETQELFLMLMEPSISSRRGKHGTNN